MLNLHFIFMDIVEGSATDAGLYGTLHLHHLSTLSVFQPTIFVPRSHIRDL